MKMNLAGATLQNMEHCPGSVSAFRKNLKDGADKAAVAKAAKAVDSYLAIEDKAKKSGATEADVQKMKGLIDNAKSVISKAGLEGHTYHDMHLAKVKKMMKEDIQSADKKPEKYIGPDGKTKIRMVPVDRQVVKKEANMNEISLKDLQKKITSTGMASTKKASNMDKTKNDLAALRKRLSGLTPVKEAVEDDEPASPDEAGMAMDQAKFIGYVAEEIMEYIQGNNEFPEWMQNKLTALHEKAKGMHAVMAGKYNESVEVNEAMDQKKFSTGAKALTAYAKKNGGIDKADFMKAAKMLDQIGRINILQAGQLLSQLNRFVDGLDTDVRERIYVELKKVGLVESVQEANKPMKSRFGGAVDSKKFDAYKKFVKQRNVDEPTVRMVIDNPNDAESKRMMKIANIAKAVELRKAAMKESISEKLSVSDGMGTWIDDFKKSDAPQFKDKSDKERRDMAIAAYLSAKKDKQEGYVSMAQQRAVWATRKDGGKGHPDNKKGKKK